MNFKPKFEKKGKENRSANYEPITKYMATDLITFHPETEIMEVIKVMLENRISGAPVLNEKKELVGLISEKDCVKVMIDSVYHNQPISKSVVSQYMATNITTINVNQDVMDVASEFMKKNFKRFPIVDDKGILVGLVCRSDLLKATKAMDVTTW